MIIKDVCKPGNIKNLHGWIPKLVWPQDCIVWFEENAMISFTDDIYRNYCACVFYVSFSDAVYNISGIGQGIDLDAAEQHCWENFHKIQSCEHTFDKAPEKDGRGICSKCGFVAYIYECENTCFVCEDPTDHVKDMDGRWYCENCQDHITDLEREKIYEQYIKI